MRVDIDQASVQTIYVTVWASPNVSLHLGKIENADETWKNHIGIRLQVRFCVKESYNSHYTNNLAFFCLVLYSTLMPLLLTSTHVCFIPLLICGELN